ncbi:MAG: sulfurtransferase-like selenium metabolism protein YedF, partial [Spirochaetota bacterium]
ALEITKENDLYKIYASGPLKEKRSEAGGASCIVLSANYMGRGDEDLGKLLIQGFVNIINEMSPLPETIICYNSGVKLAAEDSSVLASLKALQNSGVDIIVCGTCADYFKIKDKIAAGRISNMYEILEKMAAAGKIINP